MSRAQLTLAAELYAEMRGTVADGGHPDAAAPDGVAATVVGSFLPHEPGFAQSSDLVGPFAPQSEDTAAVRSE